MYLTPRLTETAWPLCHFTLCNTRRLFAHQVIGKWLTGPVCLSLFLDHLTPRLAKNVTFVILLCFYSNSVFIQFLEVYIYIYFKVKVLFLLLYFNSYDVHWFNSYYVHWFNSYNVHWLCCINRYLMLSALMLSLLRSLYWEIKRYTVYIYAVYIKL